MRSSATAVEGVYYITYVGSLIRQSQLFDQYIEMQRYFVGIGRYQRIGIFTMKIEQMHKNYKS